MKAAVAALACLLRLATPALASEPARSMAESDASEQAPATAVAAQTTAQAKADTEKAATQTAQTHADVARRDNGRPRFCFSPAETRDTVAAHRLEEPFRALRVGRQQGEALRAKLCKWKQDQFIYEIFVLRRDGRIVRVYMNAQNGQVVGALEDH